MLKNDFLSACGSSLCETPFLQYVGGYKYQSRNNMIYKTPIRINQDIITDLIVLRRDGWLWIGQYFAWDGCSGPTWDDRTNQRAGQAHDGLYALHRLGLLPLSFRPLSDSVLSRLMRDDGAMCARANYYEWAVNHFGESSAVPNGQKEIKIAP